MAVLIQIKKHEKDGISKRDLSALTGVNHNSIVKWRKMYESAGIAPLPAHGRIGFKKSVVSKEEHKQIEKKLSNPTNGIRGYVELGKIADSDHPFSLECDHSFSLQIDHP